MEEAAKKDKSSNKWISIVDKLAKGDITKHNEVYKINYIHSLNMLSHWKQIEQKDDTK